GNLLRAFVSDGSDGSDATTIDYVVDGFGRRIAKRVGGQFSRAWLYQDQLRPASELTADGVLTHFVYTDPGPGGAPDLMYRAGVPHRLVKDHLGSVRLVVNAQTGTIAQRLDYDEFGRVLVDTNPGFQPFGFAGGLYDPDTKLVRFGARDYDPATGRWTAKDPIGFAGGDTNLFVYAANDSINLFDHSGCQVPPEILAHEFMRRLAHAATATAKVIETAAAAAGTAASRLFRSSLLLVPVFIPGDEPLEGSLDDSVPFPLAVSRLWRCTASCNVDNLGTRVIGEGAG